MEYLKDGACYEQRVLKRCDCDQIYPSQKPDLVHSWAAFLIDAHIMHDAVWHTTVCTVLCPIRLRAKSRHSHRFYWTVIFDDDTPQTHHFYIYPVSVLYVVFQNKALRVVLARLTRPHKHLEKRVTHRWALGVLDRGAALIFDYEVNREMGFGLPQTPPHDALLTPSLPWPGDTWIVFLSHVKWALFCRNGQFT